MALILFLLMRLIIILVIVHVILSYFMTPYHPVREAIDHVVEPMLAPIRRFVPPLGGLDFSPLVLILLVQLLGSLLIGLF
jgi:YggT family protein